MRHKHHDYNTIGAYFITICTKEKRCMLSHIVGTGVPDGPCVELTEYGKVAEKYSTQLNNFYSNIIVEKYVIMPNHVHLMLRIPDTRAFDGPSRTPVPTVQNSTVSKFVSTFKRFCNKEYGENIWQMRSYDHIIRNSHDYDEIMSYIDKNPLNWIYDELYSD